MAQNLLGAIFLIIASSILGTMYVVVKIIIDYPPIELVFLGYTIAIMTLLIIGVLTKQSWRISKRYWLIILAVDLIDNMISIVTQEAGTKHLIFFF